MFFRHSRKSTVLIGLLVLVVVSCSSNGATGVQIQTPVGQFLMEVQRSDKVPPGCSSSLCTPVSKGWVGFSLVFKSQKQGKDDSEACMPLLDSATKIYLVTQDGFSHGPNTWGWDVSVGCFISYTVEETEHDLKIYWSGKLTAIVKSDQLALPDSVVKPIPDSAFVYLQALTGSQSASAPQVSTPQVKHVAWSPDGKLLAAAGDNGTINLWKMPDRSLYKTFAYPNGGFIRALEFSPDGTMLAASAVDGVYVWTLADMDHPRFMDALGGENFAFSPDGKLLAISADLGSVGLWNITSETKISTLTAPSMFIGPLAFSPDGSILAVTGSGIQLLHMPDGALIRTLSEGEGMIDTAPGALAFSPDGTSLAVAENNGAAPIRLWSVKDGKLLQKFEHHTDVTGLSFFPDGKLFASAPGAFLWSVTDTGPFNRLADQSTASVAFSPDGSLLAAGADDSNTTVYLWQVKK